LIQNLINTRKNVSHQHLMNQPAVQVDPLDESKFNYHNEPLILQKI